MGASSRSCIFLLHRRLPIWMGHLVIIDISEMEISLLGTACRRQVKRLLSEIKFLEANHRGEETDQLISKKKLFIKKYRRICDEMRFNLDI
jgi:hypothetical protein